MFVVCLLLLVTSCAYGQSANGTAFFDVTGNVSSSVGINGTEVIATSSTASIVVSGNVTSQTTLTTTVKSTSQSNSTTSVTAPTAETVSSTVRGSTTSVTKTSQTTTAISANETTENTTQTPGPVTSKTSAQVTTTSTPPTTSPVQITTGNYSTQSGKAVTSTIPATVTTNSSLNATSQLATGLGEKATTSSSLTRGEALVGFAIAACVLLVVCGYFLVTFSMRRYRRWQLNRLLLSIRGDVDADLQVQGDEDDSPDDAVFVQDPLNVRTHDVRRHGNRIRNDRPSTTANATASFSRLKSSLRDRIALRGHEDADCDLLIAERADNDDSNEAVSLLPTQSLVSGNPKRNQAPADQDEPILVLEEPANENAGTQSRNDSLI